MSKKGQMKIIAYIAAILILLLILLFTVIPGITSGGKSILGFLSNKIDEKEFPVLDQKCLEVATETCSDYDIKGFESAEQACLLDVCRLLEKDNKRCYPSYSSSGNYISCSDCPSTCNCDIYASDDSKEIDRCDCDGDKRPNNKGMKDLNECNI